MSQLHRSPERVPAGVHFASGHNRAAVKRSGKWGPAVLYPSSPGLLVLLALQVGSDVPGQDCPLFLDLTHLKESGLISSQPEKKPSLTLIQPTWLAKQVLRMGLRNTPSHAR
jgi:hypothetical protein